MQNEKVYGNQHYLHYWAAQSKDKTPKPQFYRQWGLYTSPATPLEKRVKYDERLKSARIGGFARGKISTNGEICQHWPVLERWERLLRGKKRKTPIKWGSNLTGEEKWE